MKKARKVSDNNIQSNNINFNCPDFPLSCVLQNNKAVLENLFKDYDDIIYRTLTLKNTPRDIGILIVCIGNLVDLNVVNENIIKPINLYNISARDDISLSSFDLKDLENLISVIKIKRTENFKDLRDSILSGSTVLMLDGYDQGLLVNTPTKEARGIEESPVESIIRGPRDSFIENIDSNIGLVRKKLKSPYLKIKQLALGSETNTTVSVLYMDNIVNKNALNTLLKDIEQIQIDGIFESGYIEQLLENRSYSPFPQTQFTERPDKVCGNLLEGRIIILVDGSPQALIFPTTFFQLFQSPEDYYERSLYGSFIRFLRFIGFFVSTSLPSIYVALISFHHEMLPMDLVVDLSRSRAQVPFPPVVEALLMEVTIELLREASGRLPTSIGQTIGIVGAIVIGDAAITANIASPTMVIVVAITALGSYVLPHYSTSYALRILRFPIIVMAATFGAFGIVIAWAWVIIHLCSLSSLGYPYLSPLSPLNRGAKRDFMIRGTIKNHRERPDTVNAKNKKRW